MESPWRRLPQSAPFVLPEDAAPVAEYNHRVGLRQQVRVEALPFPYLGARDAPIVILSLNPGFQDDDVRYQVEPNFRSHYTANLAHTDLQYPLFLLDPRHEQHPGHRYWRTHLRQLCDEVGVRAVARSVLVVEWFPYPSVSGLDRPPLLNCQNYSFMLVREAISRLATIIQSRARRDWTSAIPELTSYEHRYKFNSPQAGTLSRKNCPEGFERALRSVR